MTEIKRYKMKKEYSLDINVIPVEDHDGSFVQYADHAAIVTELQEQVRALAAEGKKKSNCLAFFASVIKCGESWSDTCQRDYDAAFKTSATDVVIREIRAQAVELASRKLRDIGDKSYSGYELECLAKSIRSGEQP